MRCNCSNNLYLVANFKWQSTCLLQQDTSSFDSLDVQRIPAKILGNLAAYDKEYLIMILKNGQIYILFMKQLYQPCVKVPKT